MCYKCLRMFLLVVGVVLLVGAIFPVLYVVRLPDTWDVAYSAMKLLMLPVGGICLLWAAAIHAKYSHS